MKNTIPSINLAPDYPEKKRKKKNNSAIKSLIAYLNLVVISFEQPQL